MRKLLASIHKEIVLLIRDWGGLAILFIMPLVLIVTITLIQDSTFKSVGETRVPVVFVDYDNDSISFTVKKNFQESEFFELVTTHKDHQITEEEAKKLVGDGTYKLAIVVPENLSHDLNTSISNNVNSILSQYGLDEDTLQTPLEEIPAKEIKVYFDPASGRAFRNSVTSAIGRMIAKTESKAIYKAFQEELGETGNSFFKQENLIVFKETSVAKDGSEVLPNSVQHNVPAWALFAIFFIVVPLSINIVKEKNLGTYVRLRTLPVSNFTVIAGKIITYSIICLIQFALMLAVGVYVFPYMGLPHLEINNLPVLFVIAFFAGLAAIGYGVLIGTIAKTQEQSAPFGAISVVILAAIGGVWVPTFVMPRLMQELSAVSPLNWGLDAFYDVFLRGGGLTDVLPQLLLLSLFFIITLAIALLYDEKKRAI